MQATKNILIVIAHPRRDSFNYSIADQISSHVRAAGHHVMFQDLYVDKFNPVLTAEESLTVKSNYKVIVNEPTVEKYQKELTEADILIVIHPNWWGKPPAILSGWIDRVLAPNVAYKLPDGTEGKPQELLQFNSLIITTGDTPEDREKTVFGDPLQAIWLNCILPYVGSKHNKRIHLSPVSASTDSQRSEWVTMITTSLNKILDLS